MDQPEFDFNAPPKRNASEVSSGLLDKIKKLLRLASSSNPHEAALAMSRAMALADRANLDLSTLNDDDDVGEIIQRWLPVGSRLSREKQLSLGIIQTYFNVTPVFFPRRGELAFIGLDSDIAIAEYVFSFLTQSSRGCLKAYEAIEKAERRKATGTKKANFLAGFFYGIAQQLKNQRQELILEDSKFAIVLADRAKAREEYSDNHLGKTRAVNLKKPRRNLSALESGYEDGRRTSISPGLETSRPPTALLER